MVDKNVDKTTWEADNRPPTPARPPTTRLTQRLGENGRWTERDNARRDGLGIYGCGWRVGGPSGKAKGGETVAEGVKMSRSIRVEKSTAQEYPR